MSVTTITPSTSKEFLEANKDALVVLFFDAEFSGQQDVVTKAIDGLKESSDLKDKIVLGTVDVEENNELATQFSVLSVPLVVCVKNDQTIRRIDTIEPSKVVNIIREELNRLEFAKTEDSSQSVDPKDRLKEYLKKLINKAPVMVFMKGEPTAPRCGFSRQVVELLAKHDIKYESFDILQDEEVRQGLKEYSDWPTYPQIYAKGELIGGLDILKQLEESGELVSTLKV